MPDMFACPQTMTAFVRGWSIPFGVPIIGSEPNAVTIHHLGRPVRCAPIITLGITRPRWVVEAAGGLRRRAAVAAAAAGLETQSRNEFEKCHPGRAGRDVGTRRAIGCVA